MMYVVSRTGPFSLTVAVFACQPGSFSAEMDLLLVCTFSPRLRATRVQTPLDVLVSSAVSYKDTLSPVRAAAAVRSQR